MCDSLWSPEKIYSTKLSRVKPHRFSVLSPDTWVSCSSTIGVSVSHLVALWVPLVLVRLLTTVNVNKFLGKTPAPSSPLPCLVQYSAKPRRHKAYQPQNARRNVATENGATDHDTELPVVPLNINPHIIPGWMLRGRRDSNRGSQLRRLQQHDRGLASSPDLPRARVATASKSSPPSQETRCSQSPRSQRVRPRY
jgi:hypothetical protein